MAKKIFSSITIFSLLIVANFSLAQSLVLPSDNSVDLPEQANVPYLDGPVYATDVELGEKITIHDSNGLNGSKKPGKKPPTPSTAATGVIGALTEGIKYAIVVGISDYPGTSSDLEYTDNDANDMKAVLMSKYGYSKANITLLLDMDASKDNIYTEVNNLKDKVGSNDEVVFFFSGHGARGKADDGDAERTDEALVTHNGIANGSFEYIWDGELKGWFDDFGTDRIIFIFDTCYSGGMNDIAGTGRIVVTASGENQLSYEFDSMQNGNFTYYFVEQGMQNILADTNRADGMVTIEEAFDYTKANIFWQTPVIRDFFTNDLLL